jgi:hypothetical protein
VHGLDEVACPGAREETGKLRVTVVNPKRAAFGVRKHRRFADVEDLRGKGLVTIGENQTRWKEGWKEVGEKRLLTAKTKARLEGTGEAWSDRKRAKGSPVLRKKRGRQRRFGASPGDSLDLKVEYDAAHRLVVAAQRGGDGDGRATTKNPRWCSGKNPLHFWLAREERKRA